VPSLPHAERSVPRDPVLTKEQQAKVKKVKHTGSVITSWAAANRTYTAAYLYAIDARRAALLLEGVGEGRSAPALLAEKMAEYAEKTQRPWTKDGNATHELWNQRRRQHLSRHAAILGDIIRAMRRDPSMSWNAVSGQIGNWCSGDAIRRLFDAHEKSTYLERILPLMTADQRKKAVTFAKHVVNKWGISKKAKVLWITCDEKWFLGLTPQRGKLCEWLGLMKSHLYAQHKNHVAKVMAIVFTGYAFDGSVENGGTGLKLGCFRCQSARIAGKAQNKAVRGPDGRITFPGPDKGGIRLRNKGDPYMVDCPVTGSDEGTSDDPKFALLPLLREFVFKKVLELTKKGGKYEGYIVNFQWDNAGPHKEAGLMKYINAFCKTHRWHWNEQSPQLPHSNPQDLYVFPLMARRHAEEMKKLGHAPRSGDDIWKRVEQVWKAMPSADVAAAHLLVKRLMEKLIKTEGDTRFLNEHGKHCGIRRDFAFTDTGIAPRSS
jgi:hypothetical protein